MRRKINLRFKFQKSKCENSKSVISLSSPSMNLTAVPAYLFLPCKPSITASLLFNIPWILLAVFSPPFLVIYHYISISVLCSLLVIYRTNVHKFNSLFHNIFYFNSFRFSRCSRMPELRINVCCCLNLINVNFVWLIFLWIFPQ